MSSESTAVDAGGPMRLLDVKGLSSGYSGVPVVRGVNIHIDSGEVVAIIE